MGLQVAKLSVKHFCYKHLLVIFRNHTDPFFPRTTVIYSGQSCFFFFNISFPEPLDSNFIQDEHLTHWDQSNFLEICDYKSDSSISFLRLEMIIPPNWELWHRYKSRECASGLTIV